MMGLRLSLAQLALSFGNVDANLARAETAITEAAAQGSDLVLLPELWASGYDLENWPKYATPLGEGVFQYLASLAKTNKIAIGGSLLERQGDKAFNTFVLYGAKGEPLGIYRKVHLFRLLQEEKWLTAGDQLGIAETPWGSVGLSICYDLRFPEMFRPYASEGVRLLLITAEWPEKRAAHWTKLLQARAIENQFFVAGVNKVGESQGVKLGGRSAVVDPWGVPICEGRDDESLLTVEIDLTEVKIARRYIPALQDRRQDVYGKIKKGIQEKYD